MPELQQKSFQKRGIAYKIVISGILSSSFNRDALLAGYINLNGLNISRANIIATLVDKVEEPNYASAVIDDGTGRISLRSFENRNIFLNVGVGDVVLVIGKIREFNNEKYLLPEIVRKITNVEWINVRKVELARNNSIVDEVTKIRDKKSFENGVIGATNIKEEIYLLIKKLDNGVGAGIDEVIRMSNNAEAENIINRLLESGDIFEIKSGKIKVLE